METMHKVLVVDDEKGICENVEKILSKNNYEVTHALSAREAMNRMAVESFSLLISDLVMPEMDGLELLGLVKKQWPLTKVLMMTAYASVDTAVKAIQLGALDYVPKPFTPDELRGKVVDAIGEELIETHVKDIPENYCTTGESVCDIFNKLGTICKAGRKNKVCPKRKAEETGAKRKKASFNHGQLIGIDMPFNYEEVVAVTGPEYVMNLNRDGMSFLSYEELKKNIAQLKYKDMTAHDVSGSAGEKILVIEDEVAVSNNVRKILAKRGHQVDQAMTKDEALYKISEKSYKIILLDLRIPKVKGLELLKAIREKQPETKVIIITGYASIETAVETTRLGAVDFIPKPFTPDEIRDATDRAFQMAA